MSKQLILNLEEMNVIYKQSLERKPALKTWLFYISDRMGTSNFFFFETEEEWRNLIATLPFEDYLIVTYNKIPNTLIENSKLLLKDYKDKHFENIDTDSFSRKLNDVIQHYYLLFFGSVKDFIEGENEHALAFIKQSGLNPKRDIEGFLEYLHNYNTG